jgi:hypothetical protein
MLEGVGVMMIVLMGPVVTGVAKANALVLMARAITDEELRWPALAQLELLSLAQSAAA